MDETFLLCAGPSKTASEAVFDRSLIRRMYAGHFLSRWGARMWEFSVGLYMISIWPDSLLFAAVYGVVESASIAVFGPTVGSLVDHLTDAQVLRRWQLTQCVSFVAAAVSMTVLLFDGNLKSSSFETFTALIVVTNVSGAAGVLSTLAGTILIERDWVVVISEGLPPEQRTEMNSIIRRIDLACKLLAPVFAGFLMSFIPIGFSAVVLAIWNLVSTCLQYWLLVSASRGIPVLRERRDRSRKCMGVSGNSRETTEESGNLPGSGITVDRTDDKEPRVAIPCLESWVVYLKQEVLLPGVSLSFLYFTALSFGTLMIATLSWKGIPAFVISLVRGFSAIIGIAATVTYPVVRSHISALRAGLWSIWIQWICLSVCLASVWVADGVMSAWMLMIGVAASRLGLWMFDLSVLEQMQDDVPESDRIVVGGVQSSLQSVFDMLTYIMGIIISNPKDFGDLVVLSFFMVSCAALACTIHVYRVRKHLFHFDKLFAFLCPK